MYNSYNAFHAAGVTRLQIKYDTKCCKNVEIIEFQYNIWNHHGKCIQISTNMPCIGSLIREIKVKIQQFEDSKQTLLSKNEARVKVLKQVVPKCVVNYVQIQYLLMVTADVCRSIHRYLEFKLVNI